MKKRTLSLRATPLLVAAMTPFFSPMALSGSTANPNAQSVAPGLEFLTNAQVDIISTGEGLTGGVGWGNNDPGQGVLDTWMGGGTSSSGSGGGVIGGIQDILGGGAGCSPSNSFSIGSILSSISSVQITGLINSTGAMASESGQQAEIQQIASTMNNISKTLANCIDANIDEINKQGAATRSLLSKYFDYTMKAIHNNFVALGTAQQRSLARHTFGEQARTTSLCGGEELAIGSLKGKADQKLTQQAIRKTVEDWGTKAVSRSATLNHIRAAVKPADIRHDIIAPINGTLSDEDIQLAVEINNMIMNPTPPIVLHPDLINTKEGERYEAAKKILRANQLAGEHVKQKVIASMSASYELGDWAQDVWENMGESGDVPGVIDGKISNEALLNLLVDSRFRSPAWYKKLKGETTDKEGGGNITWLKRQRLTGNVILLEIQKQQFEYTRLMAELLAEDRANEITAEMNPVLETLRKNAIAQN